MKFFNKKINVHQKSTFLLLVVIVFGVLLRLDQFLIQTLIDDEWHAVHKILQSNPKEIFFSFGLADYSIPLTLFYWLESKLFGLSEFLMRWPMMLSGLVTLILLPIYIFKNHQKTVAILFGFLLAFSPILITYSRTARPYSITIFLVFLSIWLFYKIYNNENRGPFQILLYSLITALTVWLHLITVMYIVAPFLLEFGKLFFKKVKNKKTRLLKLIYIGLPAAILIVLLVLPPLMNDYGSLSGKTGKDLPTIDSAIGLLFIFSGTHSLLITIIFSILSLIGMISILKNHEWTRSILLGFLLTLIFILITKPAWVHHALTFSRYLLPAILLYLLSVANGAMIIYKNTLKDYRLKNLFFVTLGIICALFYTVNSPILGFMKKPNSNTNHSIYSLDYRKDKNLIADHINSIPVSNYWHTLSTNPSSLKIAVVPWYYVSYDWYATLWESSSKQYIVPGLAKGLCDDTRKGEVPNNDFFKFKNLSYPALPDDIQNRNIDLIVFQKLNRSIAPKPHNDFSECQLRLEEIYGKHFYEDEYITVYETKNSRKVN